ncbi:MAG: hypothetical protein QM679_10125 [Patulibacter sp.]
MIRFEGGPADGRELSFARLPVYLRVVTRPSLLDEADGLDVLDQLDDTPEPGEHVHVYRLYAYCGFMHTRWRDGHSTITRSVVYRHMPTVDGEQLRDTEAWRQWATNRPHVVIEHLKGGER